MNPKPWKPFEINILEKQYNKIPIKQLSIKLNRPIGGIHLKAFRLSLTKHYNQFTPEEDNFLRKSDPKASSDQLALLMNHPASAIRQRRRFLGISSPQIKNPWIDSQRNLLKELYPQRNFNSELEKILGHPWRSINHEAQKLKLRRGTHPRIFSKRKRDKFYQNYFVNDQFFQTWSPEMAYILGFIFGDGNIANHTKSSQRSHNYVRFSSKDREILKKIQRAMKSNHPIKKEITRKKFIIYRLVISSKVLQNDLEILGISQTKFLQFPDVPSKFLNSFVRGYFDADGNISLDSRVTFYSISKDFLNALSKAISNEIGIRFKESCKRTNRNMFNLRYSKQDALKILNWLYRNSTIYLERKFQCFIHLKKFFLSWPH